MSQDPTKFDPKETTEAKLCAYVDGELDANGRAEIEKYLETNPQHRKLLKELTQTRELMRALPRASAPADIGELLHGQLERSLLLNDLDTEPEAENMRISHAAQFRAVAAVILLAVGLGAIVYFVLPSSNQRTTVVIGGIPPAEHEAATTAPHNLILPEYEDSSRSIAAAPRAASSPALTPAAPAVAQADPFSGQDRAMAKIVGKAEGEVNRTDLKNMESAPRIGGGGVGTFAAKGKFAYDSGAKAVDPFRSRVQQTLLNANATQGQPASNFTCVVVSTTDPVATKERVNTFLVSNKIQWQPIEEPMPAPIQFAQSQIALGSRLNQTTVQLRRAEDINGAFKVGSNVGVVSNGEPQTPGTQALVGALPSSAPHDIQFNLNAAGSAGAPAATAPSAPIEVVARQPARQSTTDELKQIAQQQQKIDALNLNNLAQQPVDASEQYIVARNMTTAQTVELKDLLSRQGGPHTVEVFDALTIDEPATKLRDLDKARETLQLSATEPSDDTLVANAPAADSAKRDLKKDAAGSTTAASVPLVFSRNRPATDSATFAEKELFAATTQSVAENRLKLEPSTQQTQDVVIVFRNDVVEGQFQQAAPTTAPVMPPVAADQAAPAPAPTGAPVTNPSSSAPATQIAP